MIDLFKNITELDCNYCYFVGRFADKAFITILKQQDIISQFGESFISKEMASKRFIEIVINIQIESIKRKYCL